VKVRSWLQHSTLPITSLAGWRSPGQCRRHPFLLTVERMMLVEVIMGKATGEQALAVALDTCGRSADPDRVNEFARFLHFACGRHLSGAKAT